MVGKTKRFLSPLIALAFVFGVMVSGAMANQFTAIADNATIALLDADGAAITSATDVKYADAVTVVVDGLKPNTDYTVQRGVTASSTGVNIPVDANNIQDPGELFNPSLAAGTATRDVQTDANGHFTVQYIVGDIASDSIDEKRTLTVHEGTGTSPGDAVLTAEAFGIEPVIILTLDNEAAYANGAAITWADIGFTTSEAKVNDTAGNAIAAATDCPYVLAVHGFAGETGYRTITFSQGGTDVPLWDGANKVTSVALDANGALAGATELAIPQIPAGSFPITGIDGRGKTGSIEFTVKPALLSGNTDDPENDFEILAGVPLKETEVDQSGTKAISGIGFPAGTISTNSIQLGGMATSHTAIVVGNDGSFINEVLTVASNAVIGVSDIVVGADTFAGVTVVGRSTAGAPNLTASPTTASTGDTISAALVDVGSDGAADNALYVFIDTTGLTLLTNYINSGKDALDDDDEVLFQVVIPDLANTYTAGGELQSVIFRAGSDENNDGNITDENATLDRADINLTINPKVVTGTDTNANGDLAGLEIATNFSIGATFGVDISGFVVADTIQVSVDGVPHDILNAAVASGTYTDLNPGGAGCVIQANGTTMTGGANEIIGITLGDTDGDGTVDTWFGAGDHTITVTGSTYGSTASATITVVTPAVGIQSTTSQLFSYAPTGNPYGGNIPITNIDAAGPNVIPGGTVELSTVNLTGQDFKASTAYLMLFENEQDTLNLIKMGGFTSTAEGRVPLNTFGTVPTTALPGTHNVLIAEDVDGNGAYDGDDAIVIGPNVLNVVVFANVQVSTYIRHVGDSVTVTMVGMNPENETDPNQATVYHILVDGNANGPDLTDPVYPGAGFTPDKDGNAEITFTVPEIPGGCVNLYLVEKDTLVRNEPPTLVSTLGDQDADGGAAEDAEIFITPNITLDAYTGNLGDTVAVTGKAFVPGVQYTITFGYINDVAINQRGQVLASFIADSAGNVPSGVTFTVPMANNPGYGVVIDPTPAANYVDVARDTGVGLNSSMLAGDQPIFTVGGEATSVTGASATDETHVVVTFSGGLQPATANNVDNYAVEDVATGTPVPVDSASYDSGTDTVTLTLGTALVGGTSYQVTVANLRDIYNNPVAGTESFVFSEGQNPPDETNVGSCDAACQATAPVTESAGELTVDFNYNAEVNILVGIMTADFAEVQWLDDSCAFTADYGQAATGALTLGCSVAVPTGFEDGWLFWLVTAEDLATLDWENGPYDLLFYQLGQ